MKEVICMWHLLWGWWGQIWPNLVPTAAALVWHHRRIKAHITAATAQSTPPPATDIRAAVAEELRRAARMMPGGPR
jgi:hypothetical protein